MEERNIRQRLLKVLIVASLLAIFIAISILLVGVLLGPIWLIALSVFVGICAVLCIAYILSYKKIDETRQRMEMMAARSRVQVEDSFQDVILGPPFCLYNLKLPPYEELESSDSQRQWQSTPPPPYEEAVNGENLVI